MLQRANVQHPAIGHDSMTRLNHTHLEPSSVADSRPRGISNQPPRQWQAQRATSAAAIAAINSHHPSIVDIPKDPTRDTRSSGSPVAGQTILIPLFRLQTGTQQFQRKLLTPTSGRMRTISRRGLPSSILLACCKIDKHPSNCDVSSGIPL